VRGQVALALRARQINVRYSEIFIPAANGCNWPISV
jgi:hypothetical protein